MLDTKTDPPASVGGICPTRAFRLFKPSRLGSYAGDADNRPTGRIARIVASAKRSTAVTHGHIKWTFHF